MKRKDKRAIVFGIISGVFGLILSSAVFFYSKLYLQEPKNGFSIILFGLAFVFGLIFYIKNYKDFVYAKPNNKKVNINNINMDWYK